MIQQTGSGGYLILGAVLFAAAVLSAALFRKRRRRSLPMDALEGHEFEYFCADWLREQGFIDVTVTRGSHDFGSDILAEKDGVTYAVQCKRYDRPVGVSAVQEAYAGRDYYERMIGVVMTNQYFTADAAELAQKLKILLWDRDYIAEDA